MTLAGLRSFDDLVTMVLQHLDRPVHLVAQSMGGVPTLLLWSDADAISPVTVGERLARLLPDASLVVVRGGDHMFARDRADEVAPHIERHLLGERP